jgi:GTP-binding protein
MVPADADDIAAEYQILLNELRKYNPEMLDKNALSLSQKSDMLDDELMTEMKENATMLLTVPLYVHMLLANIICGSN